MIQTHAVHKAMRDIAKKKGDFWLFGMFMRTEAAGSWELVAAAPWLESGKLKAVSELVRLLSKSVGEEALHDFTRIATLPRDSEFLNFVVTNVPVHDREVHIQSSEFLARGIQDAIIFEAKVPTSRDRVSI